MALTGGIFTGANQAIDANRANALQKRQMGLEEDKFSQQKKQAEDRRRLALFNDNRKVLDGLINAGLQSNKTPEQIAQLITPMMESARKVLDPRSMLQLETEVGAKLKGPSGRQQAVSQAQNTAAGNQILVQSDPITQAELAKTRAETEASRRSGVSSKLKGDAQKISNLKTALDQGLISPEEHANMRAEIVGQKSPELTKATISKLQKDNAQSALLLGDLDAVEKATNPEFLTLSARLGSEGLKQIERLPVLGSKAQKFLLDKVGGSKEFFVQYASWRTNVLQAFDEYRKNITGAAAAVAELDRLKKSFLNEDMGQTEFSSALRTIQEKTRRSIKARRAMLDSGLNPQTELGKVAFDAAVSRGDFSGIEALTGKPQEQKQTLKPAPNDILQQAQQAIQRGADPEKVRQRLRENGFDPGSLQ